MMDIRHITADYAVAPQIQPGDLEAIAAQGFKSIISNRPDGEEPGQPDWSVIEAAAHQAGLATRHIPISGPAEVGGQREAVAAALEDLPAPVLAFCRTGNRSTLLYNAVQGNS